MNNKQKQQRRDHKDRDGHPDKCRRSHVVGGHCHVEGNVGTLIEIHMTNQRYRGNLAPVIIAASSENRYNILATISAGVVPLPSPLASIDLT